MNKRLGVYIFLTVYIFCSVFGLATTHDAYATPANNAVSPTSGTYSSATTLTSPSASNNSSSSSNSSCSRPPVSTVLPDGRTRITDGCTGSEIAMKSPTDYTTTPSGSSEGTKCMRITTAAGGYDFCSHTDENGNITYDPVGSLQSNPDAAAATNTNDASSDNDESSENEKCYTEAGTMGWIICPVIYGLGDAAKDLYEQVEPMLRVNDTILQDFTYQGGGTYGAWSIFRDFANVIFVIMLLGVILSQVTGFGISNYGIKKILPRLITTAILVNLSFILCRVLVDVSNIVGSSINDLFNSIAARIPIQIDGTTVDASGVGVLAFVITALLGLLGIGAGFASITSAISANGWALIVPIILSLLVVGAAVLFALIVLSVRQALVVILIVLSPIAIALYMLPNTSSITQKWIKLFQGLLLVYPLCGLLIGGGTLASHIILSLNASDFFLLITGAIVCVAPYFFIPTLLMKSVNAFGNIGTGIMSGRQRIAGGVSKLKQSEGYQRKMTSWSSRGLMKPNSLRGRFARKVGGSTQMTAARSIAAAQKQDMMDRQAAASLYSAQNPDASAESILTDDAIFKAIDKPKALNQLLDNATHLDPSHSADQVAQYMATHNISAKQRQALRSYMRENDGFMNAMKSRNLDAFDMLMDTKSEHQDQQLDTYSAQLDQKHALEDLSDLSTGALERGISLGGISTETSAAMLSGDSKVFGAMQTDPGHRDLLQAQQQATVNNYQDSTSVTQAAQAYRDSQATQTQIAEMTAAHEDEVFRVGKNATGNYSTPEGTYATGVVKSRGHGIDDAVLKLNNGGHFDTRSGKYVKPPTNTNTMGHNT